MDLNPIKRIRKAVLGLSQVEMAAITGTTQGTVSKWERGDLEPGRAEMALIRKTAMDRGVRWRDSWFFEIPKRGRIT